MTDAFNNGILWVNSAGNYAQRHWSGQFADPDNDGYHNFSGIDEGNTITIPPLTTVLVYLKWDSWPVTNQDFDLYLVRSSDLALVQISINSQTGSQPPTEFLVYTNPNVFSENFGIEIVKFSANTNPRMDLFALNAPLQYSVASGSLNDFATSPRALSVGAACWLNGAVQPYSSQGPTIDGRIKPDVVGPDAVTTGTAGASTSCSTGFTGTSGAAPHVAGAAALELQYYHRGGPVQLQNQIERLASDAGTPDKDNVYGAGRLLFEALSAPPNLAAPARRTQGFAATRSGGSPSEASPAAPRPLPAPRR